MPTNRDDDTGSSGLTLDPEKTDSSLLRGIKKHDEDAAKELFDRYIGRLQELANRNLARELSGRVDTEDVTQSVFRTLFRRLQEGQYSVPEGDTIWRLLVTIALNKIRATGKKHRRAKRDIRRSVQPEEQVPAVSDDEAALQILKMTIRDVLNDLSDVQQRTIELRLQGEPVKEIAETVGSSMRTVERTLQSFRNRLHNILYGDEQDDATGNL